ncbi:MAG: HEAT repeat domain-containing protein [Parachlamydiales bacterium]|jgi:HEAT repeat protein
MNQKLGLFVWLLANGGLVLPVWGESGNLKEAAAVSANGALLEQRALSSVLEKKAVSEKEFLKQIENHFIVEDYFSALQTASLAKKTYPSSHRLKTAYLSALARAGKEKRALLELKENGFEECSKEAGCLQEISWAILKKGALSSQYSLKLAALIGMALTREAKALPFLLENLEGSNALLKHLSLHLSGYFPDQAVKDKLSWLLENEKNWALRLQVIQAVGKLKMKEKTPELKAVLGNERTTFEEKGAAIEALVQMYDRLDSCQLRLLLNSPLSGLRQLGLELAAYFQLPEVKTEVLNLADDDAFSVRFSALEALSLYYKDLLPKKALETVLLKRLGDAHPRVGLEAALVLLFLDPKTGRGAFEKYLFSADLEVARLAAGRLKKAGRRGVEIARYGLQKCQDRFVRANLALALIAQRRELVLCCKVLEDCLDRKKELWMWQEGILAPSQVRHVLELPGYPLYIDQKVQLDLLLLLSSLGDGRAPELLKAFLTQKAGGPTSFAVWALLQEGKMQESALIYGLLEDKDPAVRVGAALILAIFHKDKSVLSILEKAYSEAGHDLKLEILGALGFIGSQSSLPFLLKALDEPLPVLQIAAAAALIQITKA